MKTLLLFSLFLICTLCHAQEKGDTKIIVVASDTINLVNRIAAALYEADYSLDQKDDAVGFLLTKEKWDRKIVGSRKIKAFIKGSSIVFSGEYRFELYTTDKLKPFNQVEYTKSKGNGFRKTWDEMLSIAQQFGTQITYSK